MATTSTPSPLPKYIYKILSPSPPPPTPLPTILPLSALDARDGFIHLSTSAQILRTLINFFSSESHVYILRIPYERVEKFIRWEDTKGKGPDEKGGSWDVKSERRVFPHIHENGGPDYPGGLKLGNEEVESVGRWERGEIGWSPEAWPFEEDRPGE